MEYTDTTILDCNRQHSVQAISGNDQNTALFTNELGRGVQLDVGDKVSIQNAYISEIGAGSDTIELKGESFGKSRTIKYIHEEKLYPTTPEDKIGGARLTPLINGYQRIRSYESTFTYDLKDNETYITNQYYLNTNGESGYVFLPRRFVYPDTLDKDLWDKGDSFDFGKGLLQFEGSVNGPQFASCDYMKINGGDADETITDLGSFHRLRSDNGRLTLMRRIDAQFEYTNLRDKILREDGTQLTAPPPPVVEPCRDTYAIYQDYYKVSVTKGFNSPDNIGEEVTKQLKNADKGDLFTITDNAGDRRDITLTFNTNNYKPFLCGSVDTFRKDNLEAFNSGSDIQKSLNYYSNYYNIYCKRPEIRIAGQKVNTYLGESNLNEILKYDRSTKNIVTSFLWTTENLENIRDLFKAQKLYPELFDNQNFFKIQGTETIHGVALSVDNVRYLNINPIKHGSVGDYLGGDNLDASTDVNVNGRQSIPLFIYFDKTNEDTYTEGPDINNLCYGFALKKMVGTTAYIEIDTTEIGGINIDAFNPDTGQPPVDRLKTGTRLGYDWSFNAYGSVCACGLNGRSDKDYTQINEWAIENVYRDDADSTNLTSGLLRYNYIGATNPIFRYDSEQSRFFFSQLHTPEKAGQSVVGAGDNGINPIPPDNTKDGGIDVYKINKRVNKYTFTPDMKPYDTKTIGEYTYPSNGSLSSRTLSIKNRNIETWSIFDSVCGVYISDLGYDKEDFSRGLWGTLGFTYDELFSPPTAENNRLRRVTPDRKNQSIISTNSAIVSTDTRDYIVNQFGAVYFTTQIPASSLVQFSKQVDQYPLMNQIDPAISQQTTSINLLGSNLPRRMLRPYYTIRSDIIDDNHYIGGENSKTLLPVVGICDKQYSGGDFVFGSSNTFTFTITKKKVITSITTSITDPNQSFARVDPDSAVIYKIMKNVRTEQDLISNYLKDLEKQRKK
tara:strand:- start:2080 stop:4938 length:2859 start_codon:yes stop_codon:yes gene_type:complete